jgi:hypothetical protein
MNTPDPSRTAIQTVGNHVPNPAFPIPPGGSMPNLNLAGWPDQQGASVQPMPDPAKPDPINYTLTGDPTMGGYEPTNPTPPAPNLAGVDGWPPSPSSLAPTSPMSPSSEINAIQPQYTVPDFSQPELQPFGMSEPALGLNVAAEFQPDPLIPAPTDYNHPYGLDVHNITGDTADLWRPDPVLQNLMQPDIPDGISSVLRDLDQPDPLLPSLQNPQLTPSVHMTTRPGDLDPSALSTMAADPTAQSTSQVPYNQSFMDASGMNNTRRRHFDLMVNGLQSEEQ